MNKAIITGRLTFDPELKSTRSGISFIKFQVAVEANTNKEKTNFIDCIAWREKAEFISRYFHKGSAIEVEGEIETANYESEGRFGKSTQIKVDNVKFALTSSFQPTAETEFEEIIEDGDDMPFWKE